MRSGPFRFGKWSVGIGCWALVFLVVFAPEANAFIESGWDGGGIELRGFIQATGAASRYPETPVLYSDRSETVGGGIARLLGYSRLGRHATLELNAYQTYIATSGDRLALSEGSLAGVERSGAMEWAERADPDVDARLGLDRLILKLSFDRVDLTLGRQPVNLATTFYFTPNDFFAPFLPQAFFRVFKPGVDAARAEVRLGQLAQLSVIGALGYAADDDTDNGFARTSSTKRASSLARLSVTRFGFEWAALGGTVRESTVAGGSFQGEVFDWLGLRGEGHYSAPRTGAGDPQAKAAFDLEHRFENSLSIRLEHYYNGEGYASREELGDRFMLPVPVLPFSARHYSALDVGYEVTPLLNAEVLSIVNWIDPSLLVAFYSVYSLSDESEFSAGFSFPAGKRTTAPDLESEFGIYPVSGNIELRMYF